MNVSRRIDLAGLLDRPIGSERLLHEGLHTLLAGGLALDGFEHEAMRRPTRLLRNPDDAGPEVVGQLDGGSGGRGGLQ